jgi:hypothetical protein
MSSGYLGRHADVFYKLKLNESIFVKCLTRKERVNLSVQANKYSTEYKRKFKTKLFGQQLKITRTK